jgi:hypothetical protein
MRAPTEEEFKDWLLHPVTQSVKQMLNGKREELRQQWEGGAFTDYAADTTALVNVGNLGTCKGYAFVTELDYEQFMTEIDDGELKRPEASGPSSTNKVV